MKVLMRSMIAAAGLAAGLALTAHDAAAVTINNFDFEAGVGLTPNTDTVAPGNIPSFNITAGTGGTFAPLYGVGSVFGSFNHASNGNQVGYMNPSSAISQLTSSYFTTTGLGSLTLTFDAGTPLGSVLGMTANPANSGTIEVLDGASVIGSTALQALTAGSLISQTDTVSFTGATLSDPLTLAFVNTGSATILLDNILVDSSSGLGSPPSSIPEPRTGLPLLGIALLGFVAYHYRQKTKLLAI